MAEEEQEGASPIEQLLYAAKNDSLELAEAALNNPKLEDPNFQDGLGMTALHYAAKTPSPEVLELLLETDGVDVDLQNKMDKDTPLHLAVKLSNEEARAWVCRNLLEAGADTKIQNKYKQRAIDLLPYGHELRKDFQHAEAENAIEASDLAVDDESDGEAGGDSGEE